MNTRIQWVSGVVTLLLAGSAASAAPQVFGRSGIFLSGSEENPCEGTFGMMRRRIGDWKRWGRSASRVAACAIGVGVGAAVIVLAAVAASLFAVTLALFRSVRSSAPPVSARVREEPHRIAHAGTASRARANALQRTAADEAAS